MAPAVPYDSLTDLFFSGDQPASHRIHGIRAQCGEDVPCAHLPAVVITAKAAGFVLVALPEYFTDLLCRLVPPACERVQIYHMMTRFIAVRILSYQSRNIGGLAGHAGRHAHAEQGVEAGNEGLPPSQEGYQVVRVMQYVPQIVPGIALGIISPLMRCM